MDVHDGKFSYYAISIASFDSQAGFMLSDDTEFNTSGIGNITGMKYLENYSIYKQTLIEGLSTKSHFADLFVTWNREVFPHSQIAEVIPDSQPASFIGEGEDIRVANILQQLSLEEIESDEDETNQRHRSDPCSNYLSDHDDDIYASPPCDPSIPSESESDSSTKITTTTTIAMTDTQANPNTDTVEGLQHHQGSKASKKTAIATVETVHQSSACNAKRSVTKNIEPPPPSPIQPISTANAQMLPPKAKRATQSKVVAKGKACK